MQRAEGSEQLVLSPSDLTAFAACEHRTGLERLAVLGLLDKPDRDDPELEVLRRRGDEHERAELDRLRAAGLHVVEIACDGSTPDDLARAEADTVRAMHDGADVIYQATFFDGRWRGHADFLHKVDRPSRLGAWSYEVADTKLARRARPTAVLQLCAYSEHVARIQGVWPDEIEVVTGDGERHRHRLADAVSWYRQVKARFEAFLEGPVELTTYPHPVAHCRVCPWLDGCVERRRADDHLSLVAGMRRDMVAKLQAIGVETMAALAVTEPGAPVPGMGQPTADRLRHQARLQVARGRDGRMRWDVLEPDGPGRGLAGLPEPSPGDLFFDLEGDPWAGEGGLEYLWGLTEVDGTYHAFWAHDAAGERRALEAVVDLFLERLDQFPGMHVFHYAPYEVSALTRLAAKYGTREPEVDRLLRGDVLVDLYRIVRQGVRVSEESYGLKKLEPLWLPARDGAISDGGSSIVAYEAWLESRDQTLLDDIRAYNEVDCLSTQGLRDWLEERRHELPDEPPRPVALDTAPSESVAEDDARTASLAAALVAKVPDDLADHTDDEAARWLLAQLLSFHRREARPEWWAWFDRLERTDEELAADHECLGELEYEGVVAELGKSLVHRYRFDPAQEHKIGVGDKPADPRTGRGAGEVMALDAATGAIDLKRAASSEAPHPRSLIPAAPRGTRAQQAAIVRVAERVLEQPESSSAVLDLLRRRPPARRDTVPGQVLHTPGEPGAEAVRRVVPQLAGACLAVQGPPGSGKTWTGAAVVVDAVRRRKKIGVTAQSHKAIGNLLTAIVERAVADDVEVRIVQRAPESDRCTAPGVACATSNDEIDAALDAGTVDVVGGTPFLFSRAELDGRFDLLVVDEAGQLALANVVAVSGAATDLVLLGDPQQLPQVTRGTHPPGAGVSALEHLLGGEPTVPPHMGVFLDRSHRMHPDVCCFVSAIAYEGRLHPVEGCKQQGIADGPLVSGAGLRWVPVEHEANRTRSAEEALTVRAVVDALLGRAWVDPTGQQGWLALEDILVIAPYNAQVAELAEALPAGARIGTVDRFQGQEAPVVVYSLAASSADDVPRGLDFLLSINRFNVAVSRAKALCIVVGSPELLRAPCNTVHQVRLVNALCRFVEDATEVRL